MSLYDIHAETGGVIAMGDVSHSSITSNANAVVVALSAIEGYIRSEGSSDANIALAKLREAFATKEEKPKLKIVWDDVVKLAPGVTSLSKAAKEITSWF